MLPDRNLLLFWRYMQSPSPIMVMEVPGFSEIMINFSHTVECHILEDSSLHRH